MDSDAYVESVLRKADTLKKVGFWAPHSVVHARAWLNNFEATDKDVAAAILDSFIYFPEEQTNALMVSAYSDMVESRPRASTPIAVGTSDMLFTRVDGEEPNPSDSGNIFCRKARNILRVAEERLVEPEVALAEAIDHQTPVVFLDDFLGSGNQIHQTWNRHYREAIPRSFAEAHAHRPFDAHYIVLVSTHEGLTNTTYQCPGLHVHTTHVLGDEYSVRRLSDLPHIPPMQDLNDRIHRLLEKYAPRLELESFMRVSDYSSYGFHSLGLLVAFQHGCPDASIPLIWARGGSQWTPLVVPA